MCYGTELMVVIKRTTIILITVYKRICRILFLERTLKYDAFVRKGHEVLSTRIVRTALEQLRIFDNMFCGT